MVLYCVAQHLVGGVGDCDILYAVLFCVLLALMATLSVASIDERVTLYYENPALW